MRSVIKFKGGLLHFFFGYMVVRLFNKYEKVQLNHFIVINDLI